MHPNQLLIQSFYEAFSRKDYRAMAECYHPEATFIDAAFDLHGKEVPAMWEMLCKRGKDLELTFSNVAADALHGSADWEARYTFSQTGRKVHNIIHAEFIFRDGKIWSHTDTFDFYRWARQALGFTGLLLGWTAFLHKKVQKSAMGSLHKFMAEKGNGF
ncbi:MAG: nuclear transport factor 2 family protein [Lewinellaceae bacterium]|nr:nuclear transport factor 2 family protein [Lewinellaceae bacterium]